MFKYVFGSGLILIAGLAWMLMAPVTEANVNSRLYALCYYHKLARLGAVDCGCWVDGMTQQRSKALNAQSVEYLRRAATGDLTRGNLETTLNRIRKTGYLMKALLAQSESCRG